LPSDNFHRVSEREAYRTSLLNVVVGTFEGPGGRRFERDIVRHPGAVVVVPYDEATGEVVFVRQYRAPLDQELLEVPAGKRDVEGEPNDVTAGRELAEETGLAAGRLEELGHFFSAPGFCDEQLWCFLARDMRPVALSRHGIEEENMTLERHRLADAGQLVRSGQVRDAKTIAGLYLAQLALS
jgi:8-oxo-dGTP pyrophosphatase MutT (NUDIX family)